MSEGSKRLSVETDVIVVGGGGSGLAAAVEARSVHRRVVLLEKASTLGGSTARSIGSLTSTNTPHQYREGILDCPDDHFKDMAFFNEDTAKLRNHPHKLENNNELRRLFVDNVPETFRWLLSMGVEFYGPLPEPPHGKLRLHNVVPNSRAYIFHLHRRARRLGVDIRTSVCAKRLIMDNGVAVGVLCDTSEGETEFRARGGIVIASGDFSADPAMRAEFSVARLDNVEPINPNNTGDGHRMVIEAGGRMAPTWLYSSGVRFPPPPPKMVMVLPPYRIFTRPMTLAMRYLPMWFLRPYLLHFVTSILVPSSHMFLAGTVMINTRGERFFDESVNPASNPNTDILADQPGQSAYLILDANVAETLSKWPSWVSTAAGLAYAYIQDYRRSRKDIFNEAPTLEALAAKIGVPADKLVSTIAAYNMSEARETSNRPRLTTGPFIALGPVRYYINFTDSGVAVNGKLEVLGKDNNPIPGLYAAGFIGMGGTLLEGHGHHIGWAFTSGRLAGRAAAYRVRTKNLTEK